MTAPSTPAVRTQVTAPGPAGGADRRQTGVDAGCTACWFDPCTCRVPRVDAVIGNRPRNPMFSVSETVRYTYRLRPGATAERALLEEWGRCRWLWNEAVNQQKTGRKPTFCKLSKMLTAARAELPWLRDGSQVAQQQMLRTYAASLEHSFKVKGRRKPTVKRRKDTLWSPRTVPADPAHRLETGGTLEIISVFDFPGELDAAVDEALAGWVEHFRRHGEVPDTGLDFRNRPGIAVIRQAGRRSWRCRCDAFEVETETGYTTGACVLTWRPA